MLTVKLSSKVFKNAINSDTDVRNNNGILCTGVFECIMATFEHEIIHALIGCFCRDFGLHNQGPGKWDGLKNEKSGHSKTFMSIVNNLFGHTEYRHKLFKKPKKVDYYTELTKDQIKILKSKIKPTSIIEAYYEEKDVLLKSYKIEKMNPKRIFMKVMIDGQKYKFGANYGSIVSVDSVPLKELIKNEKKKIKKEKTINKKNNSIHIKKQKKNDVLSKEKMFVRVWVNPDKSGGMTTDGKVYEIKNDTLIYIDSVNKTKNEVP